MFHATSSFIIISQKNEEKDIKLNLMGDEDAREESVLGHSDFCNGIYSCTKKAFSKECNFVVKPD
jgi:hypothetical protein